MGAWRIMPLLSTLAALVIIVHSAEEGLDRGLERDYRYDVRPRLLDTGTPSYSQPWRNLEERRGLEPTKEHESWQGSAEEPVKRRRSLRKRKRRPIAEDTVPEENPINEEPEEMRSFPKANEKQNLEELSSRESNTEEPPRYRRTEYFDTTTAAVRRRRKRPDRRNRWADEYLDVERPGRRRGQRRKRPHASTDRNNEFSQLNDKPQDEETDNEERLERFNVDLEAEPTTIYIPQDTTTEGTLTTASEIEMNSQPVHLKEDRSLSEFSLELPSEHNNDNKLNARETVIHNAKSRKHEERQENRPIDPSTLKEILKRSNGASLSEILQQHNLSLSDLLRGKEDAISVLKSDETFDRKVENVPQISEEEQNQGTNNQDDIEQQPNQVTDTSVKHNEINQNIETTTDKVKDLELQSSGRDTQHQKDEVKEDGPKIASRRRIPAVRRKLRLRAPMNSTYKGQLNRDLMALTARKYQHNRNITKSKEWKDVLPMMTSRNETVEDNSNTEADDPPTTTASTDDTTTVQNTEYFNPTTEESHMQTDTNDNDSDEENANEETTLTSFSTTQETTTSEATTTTESPKVSRLKPAASRMGLRRQAFNNRLKRKRLRQKNSTTAAPSDKLMFDLFGMPDLVSSSEFIARTQSPKTTNTVDQDDDFTTLEDFITTEKSRHAESGPRFTRNSTIPYLENNLRETTSKIPSTTEETAKFEIEEILNDTRTSARLSRILMERNMTLNELVEHRERGSSHVHLADIFHNASKEPNPPEPFLSKSSIEPISKETYPLRAILEANLHESTAKATTIDTNPSHTQFVNIPVVMDFGNNVNENAENMGIMSLFNKLTENEVSGLEKSTISKDSEGTPYVTTVISVNHTDSEDTQRKSRKIKGEEDNLKHDIVGWNELFDLMRKNNENLTEEKENIPKKGLSALKATKKVLLQDADGDGLIVFEDLERLKELNDIHLDSDEKLEINTYEKVDVPIQPGILDRAPSNTRSVTVATASIVGLAMILFLLTYAAFKWKQQRSILTKKQNFNDDRIPTPVFENRKGHKNNCSTRSISPMLNSSNIYTMNTLDSNTGKESPDYMWDSLRKPFQ